MAKSVSLNIEGLDDIKNKLRRAPAKLQKGTFTKMTNAGATRFIKSMRGRIPTNMNTYRKSLFKKKRRSKSQWDIRFTISPSQGKFARYDAWYAHILEFGARPHEMKGLLSLGSNLVFSKIKHPGAPAYRFMTKTFINDGQSVIDAVVDKGRKELIKQKL